MLTEKIPLDSLVYDDVGLENAAKTVVNAAKNRQKGFVVTPNAAIAQYAHKHPAFAALLQKAFLTLPDGVGVTLGAKIMGKPFAHGRVAGVALGEAVARLASKEGLALYLFGGKEGVAEKAADRLQEKYPALLVAGTSCGFGYSLTELSKALQGNAVPLVFCCLGSPLQERVAAELCAKADVTVLCLGGSLDVYAGEVRRAPAFWQKAGCEWLWRTLAQPSRIKRLGALFAFALRILYLKIQKTLAIDPIKGYNKLK